MFLNHGPQQWCSGPRMMIKVWIWYPIIPWMLYEARTTSDMLGSPSRQHHDPKLHPRHTQLVPWILEIGAWTMALINGAVFQGWEYGYIYAIPLFCEYYMRHIPPLTGMDHPLDQTVTTNNTPDIIRCYPGFRNQELEPYISSVV